MADQQQQTEQQATPDQAATATDTATDAAMADAATGATATAAATDGAQPGAYEDMLDADTMLSKHPNMTAPQLARLLASVAQRNAEDRALFEKERAELAKLKEAHENLAKTHEEEILENSTKWFNEMKAAGVSVPEDAAQQFAALYEQWGPQERIDTGRVLQRTVFAHSASFAEANRRKDEEIERLKRENFQISQKLDAGDTDYNHFKQMIDGRGSAAASSSVPNMAGGDGNARPLKRSKPERNDLDISHFLPPTIADSSSSV